MDGDGSIGLEEFSLAVRVRMRAAMREGSNDPVMENTEEAWAKIVALVDAAGDQWKRQIGRMFDDFDDDGNGEVDMEELGRGNAKSRATGQRRGRSPNSPLPRCAQRCSDGARTMHVLEAVLASPLCVRAYVDATSRPSLSS